MLRTKFSRDNPLLFEARMMIASDRVVVPLHGNYNLTALETTVVFVENGGLLTCRAPDE